MKNLNIVGPQVRGLRIQQGWTQESLSAKLRLAGWNVSSASLADLEARMLPVADHHLFFLAKIFNVPLRKLFPKIDPQDPNLQQTLNRFMSESSWEDEG
jgi:transcriptional regulator with XRE-family HTH domain